jgi:LDH2 family malate/lactate/ureidoglycolate dehydrogenase
MDVLSGVLSGSSFGPHVHGPYEPKKRSGAGHLLIALNISAFGPPDAFAAQMDSMIEGLKGAPLAPGVDEIFYPGEIEARNDTRNRETGLDLPTDTLADLRALGERLGVPATFLG